MLKRRPSTEVLNDTPIAKPLNLRVPTQSERIMQYVRFEQMRAQQDREVESFEEADDFDLDDGEQWSSPYEEVFEAPEIPDPAAPVPPLVPAPDAVPPTVPPTES